MSKRDWMRRSKGKEYAFAMTYEALSNIRRNVVWHYFLRVFVVASPLSDQRFRCKIQVRRRISNISIWKNKFRKKYLKSNNEETWRNGIQLNRGATIAPLAHPGLNPGNEMPTTQKLFVRQSLRIELELWGKISFIKMLKWKKWSACRTIKFCSN